MKKSFTLKMDEVARLIDKHLKDTEQVLRAEIEQEFTFKVQNMRAGAAKDIELEIEYTLKPKATHIRKVAK